MYLIIHFGIQYVINSTQLKLNHRYENYFIIAMDSLDVYFIVPPFSSKHSKIKKFPNPFYCVPHLLIDIHSRKKKFFHNK